MVGDDKDKKTSKKGNCGAIPKTTKKSSNLNQSTPKTVRKGTLIQDKLLQQFISEAENMTQRVNRAITTWERNGRASLGKKTASNLEIIRNIQGKLSDINETWAYMPNNGEGNQTTRSVLSRVVRSVAKTTDWAFHQIDKFQQEWRAQKEH